MHIATKILAALVVISPLIGCNDTSAESGLRPNQDQQLYVTPWRQEHIELARTCNDLPQSKCEMLRLLVAQPSALWLGVTDPTDELARLSTMLSDAKSQERVSTIVLYNLPDRDCGGNSRQAAAITTQTYKEWVQGIAQVVATYDVPVNVLIEPDGLAQAVTAPEQNCGGRSPAELLTERLDLISYAVSSLHLPKVRIFVDAGNVGWIDTPARQQALVEALAMLSRAKFAGISLNVANHYSLADSIAFGERITAMVKAKTGTQLTLAIDSGRSGAPVTGWCNVPQAALDPTLPTLSHPNPIVELVTIVKIPGESDGDNAADGCGDDAPVAGSFYPKLLESYLTHSYRVYHSDKQS